MNWVAGAYRKSVPANAKKTASGADCCRTVRYADDEPAHVDQCCLRFVRTYHRDRRTHYVFGQLNSDEAYNGRSLALSLQSGAEDVLQQAQEISRVLLDLPGGFSGTLIAHMKRTGITREKLAEESMMSDTTINA